MTKQVREPLRAIVVNEPSPDALRRAYRFLRERHAEMVQRKAKREAAAQQQGQPNDADAGGE